MSVTRSDVSIEIAAGPVSKSLLAVRALLLLGSLGIAAFAPVASATDLLLAGADPASIDDLFGGDESAESAPQSEDPADSAGDDATPGSVDALFGEEPKQAVKADDAAPSRLTGFYENKIAYTYEDPDHWSLARNTLELSLDGRGAGIDWKVSGRAVYDPVYSFENYFPEEVQDDQEFEASIRETYVDISRGDLDFRLGRQHIVWGEMVGLFFADVVSAKDMREMVLQEFDILRIPQWAARAEYFKDDFHAELVWIPYMTYNLSLIHISEPTRPY